MGFLISNTLHIFINTSTFLPWFFSRPCLLEFASYVCRKTGIFLFLLFCHKKNLIVTVESKIYISWFMEPFFSFLWILMTKLHIIWVLKSSAHVTQLSDDFSSSTVWFFFFSIFKIKSQGFFFSWSGSDFWIRLLSQQTSERLQKK